MAGNLIKLDTQLLLDSIGILEREANGQVLEKVTPLAALLGNTGDANRITEEYRGECVNFQKDYNVLKDSIDDLVKDIGQVVDLSEYHAKKATVGQVSREDLSFDAGKIDTSAAMQ
jgi:hypothetical protein